MGAKIQETEIVELRTLRHCVKSIFPSDESFTQSRKERKGRQEILHRNRESVKHNVDAFAPFESITAHKRYERRGSIWNPIGR